MKKEEVVAVSEKDFLNLDYYLYEMSIVLSNWEDDITKPLIMPYLDNAMGIISKIKAGR